MPILAQLLSKIKARKAREVPGGDWLDKESLALLRDDPTPLEFLDALIAHERFADAIHFLAHAIPKREAVWWGCLCIKLAGGEDLSPKELAALTAAVRWALRPEEEYRAAAKEPAEAAGLGVPAGNLALAVQFSGGSLTPPGLPEVAAKPGDDGAERRRRHQASRRDRTARPGQADFSPVPGAGHRNRQRQARREASARGLSRRGAIIDRRRRFGSSVFKCKTSRIGPSGPWPSGGCARSSSRLLATPDSSPGSIGPTDSSLTSVHRYAW